MNIVFLQAACGPEVEGPIVRVPFGEYRIEKTGSFSHCVMCINDAPPIEINSKLILSGHSNIRIKAKEAKDLTIKFIREN